MEMKVQFARDPALAFAVRPTIPLRNPTQIMFESIGVMLRSETGAKSIRVKLFPLSELW